MKYANVTATLALVAAMGGTSYAMLPSLPTPTASMIVSGKQVRDNTLTGADIKNGSIKLEDLCISCRIAHVGPQGPAGPTGQTGQPGPAGLPGPPTPAMFYCPDGTPPRASGPQCPPAKSGGATAYARVRPDGSTTPSATSGLTVLQHGGGVYCLDNAGGAVHALSVTMDVGGGDSAKHIVSASQEPITIGTLGCPVDTDVVVTTANVQTRVNEPVGFYVTVLA